MLLVGLVFAPACGGAPDGAQDVAGERVEAKGSALAGRALKRGARGPEVLKLYQYLKAYGYFPNPALSSDSGWKPAVAQAPAEPEVFDEVLERALVLFQRAHGLPQDGVLNERTRQLMKTPRCGLPDNVGADDDPTTSFTTSGSPWSSKRNKIRYSYLGFTPDLDESAVRAALDGAFARWTAVAGLRVVEAPAGNGEIVIGFYRGDHGDLSQNAFDGPGGTLAHTLPPGAMSFVHFDEDETWSNDGSGMDLASVAVHEFGHALGLGHSNDASAVMYAYYMGIRRELAADDIQGIRSLYPNNVLLTNKSLVAGQSVSSRDGRFSLTLQSDGNLVHYWHGNGGLWSTGTWGSQGKSVWMQPDGNLVLYTTTTPTFGNSLWSTNTYPYGDSVFLLVQDDGNLTLRYAGDDGAVLWSSGTGGH